MINNNRIVPIEVIDLLSMIGLVMKLQGTSVSAISAVNPAEFELTSGSGNLLANEPVKTLDFGEGVSSATVYFIPAYNYEGFSVQGTKVTPSGAEVEADGRTLYTATLSGGAVAIAKVGF